MLKLLPISYKLMLLYAEECIEARKKVRELNPEAASVLRLS